MDFAVCLILFVVVTRLVGNEADFGHLVHGCSGRRSRDRLCSSLLGAMLLGALRSPRTLRLLDLVVHLQLPEVVVRVRSSARHVHLLRIRSLRGERFTQILFISRLVRVVLGPGILSGAHTTLF